MFFPTSLLCVILLLLGGITLADGEILSAEQTTRLREFIETVRRCHDVPGLSIAVVRGNQTWTAGFGVADKASGGRAVGGSTLFGIGSLTKAFTASLLSIFINDTERWVCL